MPIGPITSSIASPISSQVRLKADPTLAGPGALAASTSAGQAAQSTGFGDSLSRLVNSVDSSATAANTAVDQMLDGTGDVHEAMIALQRAELTLQLTVQVRNKLVQAYQDIMRMPV